MIRISKSTKITWNAVCLISSLVSGAWLYAVFFERGLVDSLGTSIISQYSSHHNDKLETAIEALHEGDLKIAATTLEGWGEIRKGDRVYPMKRELLLQYLQILEASEHPDMGHWATLWLQLDDRDVTARAYYFEALRRDPERQAEGRAGLIREFAKFPGNQTLAEFHAIATGRTGEQVAQQ